MTYWALSNCFCCQLILPPIWCHYRPVLSAGPPGSHLPTNYSTLKNFWMATIDHQLYFSRLKKKNPSIWFADEMYDVFSGQKPHRVSEISTCMDRTNLSLPISHVDTQQRKRFPWKTCANDVIWGKKKKKKKDRSLRVRISSSNSAAAQWGVTQKPQWGREWWRFCCTCSCSQSFCLSSISFSQLYLCSGNMWCVKHFSAWRGIL